METALLNAVDLVRESNRIEGILRRWSGVAEELLPEDPAALAIRCDARVAGATLKAGETAAYRLGTGRYAYLVAARGSIEVNGVRASARDGLAIADEDVLRVKAIEDAEIVLVDAG